MLEIILAADLVTVVAAAAVALESWLSTTFGFAQHQGSAARDRADRRFNAAMRVALVFALIGIVLAYAVDPTPVP